MQIYSVHVCFSEWFRSSQSLWSTSVSLLGLWVHPSDGPSKLSSSLEDSCLCFSKHTPLAAHGLRENIVIKPGSDNLNWLYSD